MENVFNCSRAKGVADTIGNWGFSSQLAHGGDELRRLRDIFNRIDCLRTNKPVMCVKYNPIYDPEAWYIKPSHERYKPVWTIPMKRPLITYSSTAEILMTSNLNSLGSDLQYPIPGRSYMLRGTDKWYRYRNECSPPCLPSCPPIPRCT